MKKQTALDFMKLLLRTISERRFRSIDVKSTINITDHVNLLVETVMPHIAHHFVFERTWGGMTITQPNLRLAHDDIHLETPNFQSTSALKKGILRLASSNDIALHLIGGLTHSAMTELVSSMTERDRKDIISFIYQ
jgi:hypothetical protein